MRAIAIIAPLLAGFPAIGWEAHEQAMQCAALDAPTGDLRDGPLVVAEDLSELVGYRFVGEGGVTGAVPFTPPEGGTIRVSADLPASVGVVDESGQAPRVLDVERGGDCEALAERRELALEPRPHFLLIDTSAPAITVVLDRIDD